MTSDHFFALDKEDFLLYHSKFSFNIYKIQCTFVSGTKMIVNTVPNGNKAMFIKIICLVFLSGNMCTETCSPYIYEVSLYKDLRFFESVFVIEKTEVYRSYYF